MAATREIEVGPNLSSEQAEAIYDQGKEAVVFALLQFAKRLAEQRADQAAGSHQTPATPWGMKPPDAQPPASRRGKKNPGGKAGHPGSRRPVPEPIDWPAEHRAECCPDCGGRLNRCAETRTRYTEDIPQTKPEVTEHTIHRDWCPTCKKKVEPSVPDALPGATLGNRVLALSAWLHDALGNTLSQIVEVFNVHLQRPLSQGGLLQMWDRLQAILFAWSEEIPQEALNWAVWHADETGWRVNGKTHWLWCVTTRNLTDDMIDRSRGSPARGTFFIPEFGGTLVSDFGGADNAVLCASRQMRLDKCVWRICCARWSTPRSTNRPERTGIPSPRNCVACWEMRFGCGERSRSFPAKRPLRVAAA